MIVHRTRHPFVGAGRVVNRRTLPLPLRPAENAGYRLRAAPRHSRSPPPSCSTGSPGPSGALRESESLAPSARLRARRDTAAGVRLRAAAGPQSVRTGRRGAASRPRRRPGPVDTAGPDGRRLPTTPDETARLYHCYRVESWDRDLRSPACSARPPTSGPCIWSGRTASCHRSARATARSTMSTTRARCGGPCARRCSCPLPLPAGSCGSSGASSRRTAGSTRSTRISTAPRRACASSPPRTGLPEYFQRSDAELYIQVLEQAVLRGVTEFLQPRATRWRRCARSRTPPSPRRPTSTAATFAARTSATSTTPSTTTVDGPATAPRPERRDEWDEWWPEDHDQRRRSPPRQHRQRAEHPDQPLRRGAGTGSLDALRAALDERGDRVVALGRTRGRAGRTAPRDRRRRAGSWRPTSRTAWRCGSAGRRCSRSSGRPWR